MKKRKKVATITFGPPNENGEYQIVPVQAWDVKDGGVYFRNGNMKMFVPLHRVERIVYD